MKLNKKMLALVADLDDNEKKALQAFFLKGKKKAALGKNKEEQIVSGMDSNNYAVYFKSFQLESFRSIKL